MVKLDWYYFFAQHCYRKTRKKLSNRYVFFKKIAGKRLLSVQEANNLVAKKIKSGKPFMVCRFGSTEMNVVRRTFESKLFKKNSTTNLETAMSRLCIYSGFFPKKASCATQFTEFIIDACKQSDLYGVWYLCMEDYMVHTYSPLAQLTHLGGLEPWACEIPWSSALKGKKVLVIHPFEKTIQSQYKKREYLFQGTDILPEFELKTLKAVQTIAGEKDDRFKTWFEALEFMYQEAIAIDFDIAIIGCGAYGMPLAGKLKKFGKQVIHLGGATQLLFGIIGSRWDKEFQDAIVLKYHNEYWTRPSGEETPKRAKLVENACYW